MSFIFRPPGISSLFASGERIQHSILQRSFKVEFKSRLPLGEFLKKNPKKRLYEFFQLKI
jgi:hypothetical protein